MQVRTMKSKKVVPITSLPTNESGAVCISKSFDDLYQIEDSVHIIVQDNVSISLLDTTNQKKIKIEVLENASVQYTILNSRNSKRECRVLGSLSINEITLEETKESILIELALEQAAVNSNLLCLASNAKCEFVQYVDHQSPMTFSNISNIGVSFSGAKVLFHTTGKIEKGMNDSKCQQISKGIVMDDNSEVTADPILLIDEYDCFANHGAAIGKMSDEDLFYLMSRGLDKSQAFLLILEGMIAPFMDRIENDELKSEIQAKVLNMIEK